MTVISARRNALAPWVARSALPVALVALACSSDPPTDPCPGEVLPAFSITVRANDGPLPADTRIRLIYGGGTEDYKLGTSSSSGSVMFCQTERLGGNAGAAGASSNIDELACELWIEGAATVSVNGGDYPELSKELKGEANECGPETVEEEFVLGESATTSGSE